MIKVECESCSAPYELDPRRIPDKGMKMRCPKCGTSFMVNKSGVVPAGATGSTGATPPPPAPLGAAAPMPTVPKHTMLGHRAPGAPAVKEDVSVPPPPPAKGTVMGLAAPLPPPPRPVASAGAFGAVPPAPAPAAAPRPPRAPIAPPMPAALPPPPAPGGAFGAAAGAFGAPPPAAPPPAAAPKRTVLGAAAPPPAAAPASRDDLADFSVSNMRFDDLPAPKEVNLPAPRAQPDDADLPAFKPGAFPGRALGPTGAGAGAASFDEDVDFGELGAAPEVDLPTPKAQANPGAPSPKGVTDLPAPKATGATAKGFADLPRPKGAGGEVDLPAPKVGGASAKGGGFTDLPAPKTGGVTDLPAPKGGVTDLPAPKGGVTDLPAPRGMADLPAPKGGVTDLPAPRGMANLPAPKLDGGFGGLDLPAPKAGVADLPTPRGLADLPTPRGLADLPTPRGLADLPAHKQDLDLPARSAKASIDESSFGDIELPDLPAAGSSDESSFADLELPPPKPSSNLIKPKERTVQGVGAKKPDDDESSFGSIGLDDDRMDSDLPPSLRDDESNFGDLELGEPESDPPPPRRGAASTTLGNSLPPSLRTDDEIEEMELPSQGASGPPRRGGGFAQPDASYDDDGYGEQSWNDQGGEANFGEVEIGAGGGGEADDREFGIDDEDGYDEDGVALSPELLRRQRGEEFEAKQAALSKRAVNVVLRLAVVLVLLVGAGIGADFVTDYGYFGMYYFERYTTAGGDPKYVQASIERAEQMAATDTYPDVRRALKELGDTRKKAGLNRVLLTRSVVHEALFVVRFGDDAESATRAAAIMKRLEERKLVAQGIELALAADAARRKKWEEAAGKLARARAKSQNDPYVELLAGEIALRMNKPDEAEKAFEKALQSGGNARAQWGLTRVALLGSDDAKKSAAVAETLKLSPMHVEARVEEARLAWQRGRENNAHFLLRQALGLDPVDGDRYLWTSESGKASGYGVLGFMHEARGRLHQARKAYDRALKADPFRAEALLGAGRTLLREKRYDDALARFETAASATKGENPIVLSGRRAADEAQLGIGRALQSLNRAQEAKDRLSALLSVNQQDAEVTRALGRAEQALGNDEVAEAHFRKAIELAPEEFDGYLALAHLFFKGNKPDKASEVLNEAAARVEETSEMRRMLGESELARNRVESAIHEYERALELDPSDSDAKFGLGRALRKNGQLEDAKKLFESLGHTEDAMAGLEVEKGRVFEAEGEYKKAIASYSSALEKDPDDVQLLLRLGAAQVEAGDADAAEQTLQKVIREMPNSAEAEYFIGRVAFARGRTPDAMTHFDRALTLDGTQAEFHLYAGRAAFEMKNLGRTLEEIELALNIDPTLGDAYWMRGTVQVQMGAVQDALKDLKRAIKLKPSRHEAWASIGECYDQLRDLPEAIKSFKTALAKQPDNAFWWYRVARIELDRASRTEGGNALKRAISLGDEKDPMPYWLPDAYVLAGQLAEQNQNRQGAIFMYRRYLDIAPDGSIDRPEVEKKLADWNVKLTDDEEDE